MMERRLTGDGRHASLFRVTFESFSRTGLFFHYWWLMTRCHSTLRVGNTVASPCAFADYSLHIIIFTFIVITLFENAFDAWLCHRLLSYHFHIRSLTDDSHLLVPGVAFDAAFHFAICLIIILSIKPEKLLTFQIYGLHNDSRLYLSAWRSPYAQRITFLDISPADMKWMLWFHIGFILVFLSWFSLPLILLPQPLFVLFICFLDIFRFSTLISHLGSRAN